MRGLASFTASDHADEYRELVRRVRPACVGIGASVQQEGRDRQGIRGSAFDRQACVREPQQRRPAVERVAIVGERGISQEETANRIQIVSSHGSVDAVARNFGVARQKPSCQGSARGPVGLIAAPLLGRGVRAVAVD